MNKPTHKLSFKLSSGAEYVLSEDEITELLNLLLFQAKEKSKEAVKKAKKKLAKKLIRK